MSKRRWAFFYKKNFAIIAEWDFIKIAIQIAKHDSRSDFSSFTELRFSMA